MTEPESADRYLQTGSAAGPSSTLLSSIQQMLGQPLIGPNEPLLGAAAVLGGFGAGVAGKPNPVVEQLRAGRDQQLKMGLMLGDLQHKAEAARIDVLYKNAQLGFKKAEEARAQAKLDLDKKQVDVALGGKMLDIAAKSDSPELYSRAIDYFQNAKLFPMGFSAEEVKAAQTSKTRRELLHKNWDVLVAKALLGDFEDPDLKELGQNLIDAARDPQRRTLLEQHLKQVPAEVVLGRWNTEVAENATKKVQAELDLSAANITKRVAAGEPVDPRDASTLMLQQMLRKAATPDQIAMFGLAFANTGVTLPPSMAEAVGAWRKKVDLIERQTDATTQLGMLRRELTTLERHKNWIEANTRDAQVVTGLTTMLERLARAAESARYSSPAQREALNAQVDRLRREVQALLDKRAPAPEVAPPPPASPADREKALRQRHLGIGG